MNDQWGDVEGWERTLVSLANNSWKKKQPIFVWLLTSISQCYNLWRLPPLAIPPPIHSPLYRRLPGSYAYLSIMLQGCSLRAKPCRGVGWQHSRAKLLTDGLHHSLFSRKHHCWIIFPWVQVFGFFGTDSRDCLDSHQVGLMQHVCWVMRGVLHFALWYYTWLARPVEGTLPQRENGCSSQIRRNCLMCMLPSVR